MINLFPDQEELLQQVRAKIAGGCKSLLIQMATGGGKTVVASAIIKGAFDKGSSAHFVVPRRELLSQTSATFSRFGIDHTFIAAGHSCSPGQIIKICSKDTLIRTDVRPPKVAVIDEAHFGGKSVETLTEFYRQHGTILIGLSATPKRTDGKGLGRQYSDMVCGKSISWLIKNKRLSEYAPFAPDTLDLSRIKVVAGDYAKNELSERMEQDRVLIGSTVSHYKNHAYGLLGVTFGVSRKHSEMLAQAYRDAGIPAAHVDGETPDDERRRIIKAFARRELLQLCNCELLTFGFDLSSASGMDVCVQSITDAQPTKSLARQMQKWGRGFRFDNTRHKFFDHANNFLEHGLPCDERLWRLEDEVRKKRGETERAERVRICPECLIPQHPAPVCKHCGFSFPVASREIDTVEGELLEINPEEFERKKKESRMEVGKAKTIADLERIARERGYKSGWIYKQAQIKGIHK